jgi:hypothetical protein
MTMKTDDVTSLDADHHGTKPAAVLQELHPRRDARCSRRWSSVHRHCGVVCIAEMVVTLEEHFLKRCRDFYSRTKHGAFVASKDLSM